MIIPDNDFLKTIGLSTELYKLLLQKLNFSLYLLKDRLSIRAEVIRYNKKVVKNKPWLIHSTASAHSDDIRDMIAEVRLYRGFLNTISDCENTYERDRDE